MRYKAGNDARPYIVSQIANRFLSGSLQCLLYGAEKRGIFRALCTLFVFFVIPLLFFGCGPSSEGSDADEGSSLNVVEDGDGESSSPSIQMVEVQLVDREAFFGDIESSGVIRGIQEATVVSETSGVIEDVRVRLGQRISSGRVLVTLDNSLERHAVDQAVDQLAVAEIEFAAITQLYENGNSSPAELARAQASVSGSRSALALARRQFNNRVIASPINGSVAVIPETISAGNYIQPGTVIAKIVNMNQIRLNIGLGEREIQMVSVGNSARVFTDACGPNPQEAAIRAIAAGSAEQSGNFIVQIEFPNRCGVGLRSGMAARIEISNRGQEEDIIIPSRALVQEDTQYFIFVARQDGTGYYAERRPVEVARILGDRTEIASGLTEKEIIVTAPIQKLEDGVRINPITIRGQ